MKLLASLKPHIKAFLKGEAQKLALKKLLGSAMAGGFRGWLVKYIVKELAEELADPIVDLTFRKAGYLVNKVDGIINVKKMEDAREENNQEDYDDATDNIMG